MRKVKVKAKTSRKADRQSVEADRQRVKYTCKEHFEAIIMSAVLQMLEQKYTLPVGRNDREMYHEHPERWPLTERSLRQPSGKRGKGFDGLTHDVREWLKYRSGVTGPSEIMFGIRVLAWWHRDVWNSTMKNVPQKTYGDRTS
ncbi:MAG: hypothetical protein F9K29_03650 [Hyphomicrobiaceae bacterium]|nr:MAG: hypothetical protein F9K29_03650 [Hyphomicrobiaceae bacterium]